MKTALSPSQQRQRGSILAYFIVVVILATSIASLAVYVGQTVNTAQRRTNMVQAREFAVGGAVLACGDLDSAVMASGSYLANLTGNAAAPYTKNTSLSTSQTNVFQRTITSPFTNQTVSAQIWLPNVSAPSSAKIVTTATVGPVTQTATVNVQMAFAYGAAIVSVNKGTTDTAATKPVAQLGNVTVNGSGGGPLIVDGGSGLAILANGRANITTNYATVPSGAISMTNYNTANKIPDYTSQGTSNSLFDLNRFIAVANAVTNGFAPSHNNHFTNLATFVAAANKYNPTNTAKSAMEGVIVVDVSQNDNQTLDTKSLPVGINVRGTLLFNFIGSGWNPTTTKIVVDTPVNVNPADLSHLVATNPATYTTGYPPVYQNPSLSPVNVNIAPTYQNFTVYDDLPALMYSIGVVDLHNSLDICGVCYTPSYMEIENKHDGNTQYIKGMVIMGYGCYYENTSKNTISIISYDPKAINQLATSGTAGKRVLVTYWQ